MNNGWDIRISWMSRCSLYVAVAAMPFSVLITHIAILAFNVCWLFEPALLQRLSRLKNNYQILAIIALGIWMWIGVTYSGNTSEAWFALERKAFFFALPIAFATSTIPSARLTNDIQHIFCYSCALALIVCYCYAWYQLQLFDKGLIGGESLNYLPSSEEVPADSKKTWMFFSYVRLSAAINMHPTYLALYAAFCSMILVYRNVATDISKRKQIINGVLIVFFSISIIFLASRIIVLMLVVFFFGLLIYQAFIARKTRPLQFLLPILHSQYFYILLSSGLAGLSLFSVFIGLSLVKAVQNRDIIFLSFLVLFLLVGLTESVLELQKGIVFFSLFFASMNFQKAESATIVHLNVAGART